ncbi:MAG: hypothetical protein POH28_01405 [Acidocella sp.]|nr:hypothetical protein [Acidocella sp.]
MSDADDGAGHWQERAEAAEAELGRMRVARDERLIRSELKAEAIRRGMVDLDGLRLLDMDAIKMTEAGEIADAGAVLEQLRVDKPWLFGRGGSSSTAASPPRPEPARTRHANELTHDEWMAARAVLLRRR